MKLPTEKLYPLSVLRLRLRTRRGIRRTYATIWRWATEGVPDKAGNIVRLRHSFVAGVIHSSDEAIDEFFAQR